MLCLSLCERTPSLDSLPFCSHLKLSLSRAASAHPSALSAHSGRVSDPEAEHASLAWPCGALQGPVCCQINGTKLNIHRPWDQLPTLAFWPGEFHGPRSLAGYSPWGRQESNLIERLSFISASPSESLFHVLFHHGLSQNIQHSSLSCTI